MGIGGQDFKVKGPRRDTFLLLAGFVIFSGCLSTPLRGTQTSSPKSAPSTAVFSAGNDAVITFRKVFKSSYPEFVEIKLKQNGAGVYDIRQMDDDPSPQALEISPALAQKIFDLAGK